MMMTVSYWIICRFFLLQIVVIGLISAGDDGCQSGFFYDGGVCRNVNDDWIPTSLGFHVHGRVVKI